jgi:hypothetical protein
VVADAALGGGIAVLGGGKFENGAITGAFGYLFNEAGRGPNDRHQQGVEATQQYYADLGYDVSPTGQAVDVPGFSSQRIYDFIVTDKTTGLATGIEVKTTIQESIFLNPEQVEKDVVVANQGGVVATTGQIVEGVTYHAYCFSCYPLLLNVQSTILYMSLLWAGVPVVPGPKLDRRF